jgi:poly(ADP-ribose) glycohydrolase ARH3
MNTGVTEDGQVPGPPADLMEGCLLGLALGDALGAPHEGGLVERLLWRLIGRTSHGEMRWTDDTQVALDLAESLAEKGMVDADDLARRFAASYRWSRGYGPGMARLLKRISRGADWRAANRQVFRDGSFGNGGAMRAPVIGAFYARRTKELPQAARLSALVTHAHPLGTEGAVLIAAATASALGGATPRHMLWAAAATCSLEPYVTKLALAERWLAGGDQPAPKEVARRLGNGIVASESCVTALYVAARFREQPFLAMHEYIVGLGGDVDTLGAMAGALWGAANGAHRLPVEPLSRLEQADRLRAAAAALYATSTSLRADPDSAVFSPR